MSTEIIDKYIKPQEPQGAIAESFNKLKHYFTDGTWTEDAIPVLSNILIALFIYYVGVWFVRKILALIDKVLAVKGFDFALRNFVETVLSVVLRFVIALVAIEQLGVDTSSLLALLGAAGLAVGLALKDSLSNFASGVLLIIMRPFKTGDFIEAAGTGGMVEKITIFSTVLKTGDNREVIVPNSLIYGGTITNYSSQENRRIDLTIGISYDDDIRKARDIILQIIAADERVIRDPAPLVAVSDLADNSVNLLIRCWVRNPDYWDVRWSLLETIKNMFDANQITIPYPQRFIHVHKE